MTVAPARASALPAPDPLPSSSAASVALLVESCPEVDEEALRRLLRLEIGDQLLPATAGEPAPGDRLTVRCQDGDARLIAAAGSSRAPAVERTVRLSDFPGDAAPRLLALAGVELLASVDHSARATAPDNPARGDAAPAAVGAPAAIVASTAAPAVSVPTVKGAPGSPAPTTAPRIDDPDSTSRSVWSRTRLALAVVRRSFLGNAGVTAWGANASADASLRSGWAGRADLEGAVARSGDNYTSAHTYLLSAGAFWGPTFGRGGLVGALGVGARLGLTRLSGMTSLSGDINTSSVLRGWGGPAMMVHIRNGGPGWGLMLYAESGYALLAVVGVSDNGPVAAVQGIWITAGAGLSF